MVRRRLPPLRALQAFEAVARLGSVTAAAQELRITPSAVSHRLRRLEEALGVRLFHRSSRRIALTDAGRDYLESVASAFDRIERSSDRLASGGASDLLTIHCPPSFAPAWLLPRLPDFMAHHPEIDLRIHASPQPVDFFRSDADVEIRYGNADWIGLVVVPLLEDRVAPLCAPALRARLPERPQPADLARLPLLHSERALLTWEDWLATHRLPAMARGGLRFDRGYLVVQAAAMGLGVALESTVFAAEALAAGRLVRALPGREGEVVVGAHSLVFPPLYQGIRKIGIFERWIVAQAGAFAAA